MFFIYDFLDRPGCFCLLVSFFRLKKSARVACAMPPINGLTFIGNESPNKKIYKRVYICIHVYIYTQIFVFYIIDLFFKCPQFFDYSFWMNAWSLEVWGRSRLIYQNGFLFFSGAPHSYSKSLLAIAQMAAWCRAGYSNTPLLMPWLSLDISKYSWFTVFH